MKANENRRKMLKIVQMYYNLGLTQAVIAKKMGISRPVVSKLLQQAKEQGVVTISIRDENAYASALSLKLAEKYQLEEVIVVPVNEQMALPQQQQVLAQAAAAYFSQQLTPDLKIGLSWGTNLAAFIEQMPYASYPKINICPLVGGVSSEHLYYDTNHLAFQLAERLNSRCRYFYAPALAESLDLAKVLNETQLVQTALNAARTVDWALIGVGNPNEKSTWHQLGYLTAHELEFFQQQAIAGDAVASLFDKNGQTVDNELSQRMLGIKTEDLVQIPHVLVIGCGAEKAPSIQALLTGNCVNVLVIDQLLAEALVEF